MFNKTVNILFLVGIAIAYFIEQPSGVQPVLAIWPMLIAAGIGALSSMKQNDDQRKNEANAMEANAEAIRYSPWTGMKPGMMSSQVGSGLAAGLQGGLGGAMFGSQFGKGTPKPTVAPVQNPSPMASLGGGRQMSPWAGLYKPSVYGNQA